MTSYHFGFILEQTLGHITHSDNLRTNVPRDPDVRVSWDLIPFEARGLAAQLPLYKSNWTVRAGLRTRRAVAARARGGDLDAFFFHTQVPAMLATDWLRRIPSVISLDATPLQYDALGESYGHANGPAWLESLKWRLQRESFTAAHALVTWSRWAKQSLVRDYAIPADDIAVIPPGVNAAAWARSTPRDVHDGPVRVLFVGGDLHRKGGEVLIEAFRAMRAAGKPIELHLVTREQLPEEPGLRVYNQMRPNSPELKRLYHECDIFCLPTYGDCLPMVLSEAGAAGMPSISTAVAAIPEIVRNGETGLIVPTGDALALQAALEALVDRPELRLQLGEAATAFVRREYDAERNTRRLLDVLKHVADTADAHAGSALGSVRRAGRRV